jgi:benzoyl-CoA reductase/2-hydroxyglutaryl-CoA dehydratase subunit BcrC/BadD/HgdB
MKRDKKFPGQIKLFNPQDKVGITTTVPVEVIYAAGLVPVDLNNVFITSPNPQQLVDEAELAGFPRNVCSWIKGIYSVVLRNQDIRAVVAVTQGDCSNTHALMETWQLKGREVFPFAYPFDRDKDLLKLQIEKMMAYFNVSWAQVKETRKSLNEIREKVWQIDDLSWQKGVVPSHDNHLFQVNCSDFKGDPAAFAQETEIFLNKLTSSKETPPSKIRLGFIGVPPIATDLYDFLEEKGARVVFNEIQRQFTLPFPQKSLVEQYRTYTYPYGVFFRLKDIQKEIERREIKGLIHYVQSFCFRQIEDLIIRTKLKIPVLTLEGDKPGQLDARARLRLEAFLEMLRT